MQNEAKNQEEATAPSRKAHRAGWNLSRHMETLAQPSRLRRWFRQTFPLSTRFFDGQTRMTRRSVYRLFNLWLKSQGSTNEAWAAYDSYRGGDVIDVGASEGFFSLLLGPKSRAGTRHLCLEPDTRDYPRLLEHLGEAKRLFPEVEFIPLPQAAGDGRESLVTTATGPKKLPTFSVDRFVDFFGIDPDFVKIDVEGFEWTVLQGDGADAKAFCAGDPAGDSPDDVAGGGERRFASGLAGRPWVRGDGGGCDALFDPEDLAEEGLTYLEALRDVAGEVGEDDVGAGALDGEE